MMSELTYGIDSGHLNFPKDNLWRQLQKYLETELNNASDIPKPLIADTGAGDHDKAARFREQISYAKENSVIDKIYEYLSSSSIDEWVSDDCWFPF